MKPEIKILIAEDHPIFRELLAFFIKSNKNFEIVGLAENGETALEMIKTSTPQIIILDIKMPKMNGIETARQISLLYPKIEIIFLSMYLEDYKLSSLLKANAKGIVNKDNFVNEIEFCIEEIIKGRTFISPNNQISP